MAQEAILSSNDAVSYFPELAELFGEKRMPSMSAGIVKNQELVWARGFGHADIEHGIPATSSTLYRLASVSKTFAAVLVMRLVERGRLDLDTPVADFELTLWVPEDPEEGKRLPDDPSRPGVEIYRMLTTHLSRYKDRRILIRHLMTHTSHDNPGDDFRYDGQFFSALTWIIEKVMARSYPRVLEEVFIRPLGMTQTVPGQLHPNYRTTLTMLAIPYVVKDGKVLPSIYKTADLFPRHTKGSRDQVLGDAATPTYSFGAAGGIISSVVDMAKFDVALDRNQLITPQSKDRMWTPTIANDGTKLPYGMGWFVQEIQGIKVVWHYGYFPPSISSLYVKVPDKEISFIVLSNSELLMPDEWDLFEDVLGYPVGRAFLERFVFKAGN